ncbi:MAG: flagellar hook capping FlgD N-terminal domain-containing protein [Desulfobacterales bacterium]|jgi:flagellar basal-body rod modification protein FlgD
MLITALDSIPTDSGKELSTIQSETLDKDDFLSLLITQLQNQDPLNPTDSVEFTAQLAQFSSLEQLTNVNENLTQLQNFQASINNSQAVALIGKEITAKGNSIHLSDGNPVDCNFNLVTDAAVVVVTIYDQTGEYIKSFEAQNLSAGDNTLAWDGTDKDGNQVLGGDYTFEILAADVNGKPIGSTPFFSGTVSKVTYENSIAHLVSGNQKIAMGDVLQVAAPQTIEDSLETEEQLNPLVNEGN